MSNTVYPQGPVGGPGTVVIVKDTSGNTIQGSAGPDGSINVGNKTYWSTK